MTCHAVIIIERVAKNKTIPETEWLEIDNFLRYGCPNYKECERVCSKYVAEIYNKRKAMKEPTTVEEDRESWKQKKSRFRKFWSSRF